MVATLQRRPKTANQTPVAPNKEVTSPTSMSASDQEISIWRADAQIVSESDKGIRRYLRRSSLQFLLSQVKDGEAFRFKGLQTSKEFGQAEFHLIAQWLRANGLVVRNGRDYTIPSIEQVKRRWNEVVTEEAVI